MTPHPEGLLTELAEQAADRINAAYFACFDGAMRLKPVSSELAQEIRSIGTTYGQSLNDLRMLAPESEHRIPISPEGTTWRATATAMSHVAFEYLRGREHLFSDRIVEAQRCAATLHTARNAFLQSGIQPYYCAGSITQNFSFPLMAEIARSTPGESSFIDSTLIAALDAPKASDFSRAFLTPVPDRAALLLQQPEDSDDVTTIVEKLFRIPADGEAADIWCALEPCLDDTDSELENAIRESNDQKRARFRDWRARIIQFALGVPRPLVVDDTVRLVALLREHCLHVFSDVATVARERIDTLPRLEDLTARDPTKLRNFPEEWIPAEDQLQTRNVIGQVFVQWTAAAIRRAARNNGGWFYNTSLESIGWATVFALQAYLWRKGRHPRGLEELTELGVLPSLPRDPFTGNLLDYDPEKNMVSAQCQQELSHWTEVRFAAPRRWTLLRTELPSDPLTRPTL